MIRSKLADKKRKEQGGKALSKTQRRTIKKKVNKKMEKYNKNVKSLSNIKTSKKPKRTLSAL